jgi:hypothetical protein
MLNVFKCPNCRKLIETNQQEGQSIPCPYCEVAFTIRPEHAARRNPAGDVLFRIAIPIGYVLFVGAPLALTVWYLTTRAGEQPKEDETPPAQVNRNEPKSPGPRAPARPRKGVTTKAEPEEPPGEPDPEPTPKVPMPKAPSGTPVLAPLPHEVPDVFVAPEPHEVLWSFPLLDYSSKWTKAGSVDVRVAGVAVTKVPIIDLNERVTESAAPMLVVLVEARLNTAGKKRTLTSWREGLNHRGVIYLENGKELAPAALPPGGKPNTGLPFKQPLPDDGTPVRDVLLFVLPPAEAKELSLRLEAERCGESGDLWFKIPAAVLNPKK